MIMSETQEQQRRETKRQTHKMKWRNGMRKLMMVGEKCHTTWSVMCSKINVLAAT